MSMSVDLVCLCADKAGIDLWHEEVKTWATSEGRNVALQFSDITVRFCVSVAEAKVLCPTLKAGLPSLYKAILTCGEKEIVLLGKDAVNKARASFYGEAALVPLGIMPKMMRIERVPLPKTK